MKRIRHKDVAEAARDWYHGRQIEINADDLEVETRRLFRKMIPCLLKYGYSIETCLRYLRDDYPGNKGRIARLDPCAEENDVLQKITELKDILTIRQMGMLRG